MDILDTEESLIKTPFRTYSKTNGIKIYNPIPYFKLLCAASFLALTIVSALFGPALLIFFGIPALASVFYIFSYFLDGTFIRLENKVLVIHERKYLFGTKRKVHINNIEKITQGNVRMNMVSYGDQYGPTSGSFIYSFVSGSSRRKSVSGVEVAKVFIKSKKRVYAIGEDFNIPQQKYLAKYLNQMVDQELLAGYI